MKKIYFLLLALSLFTGVNAQVVNIADSTFRNMLITSDNISNLHAKNLNGDFFRVDMNHDGQLQLSEVLQVSYIDVTNANTIWTLDGITSFSNLKVLKCNDNIRLDGDLNLSGLANLEEVDFGNSGLNSVNLTGLTGLKILRCSSVNIGSLSLVGLTSLEEIICQHTFIRSLDLTGLTNLKHLNTYSCYDLENINFSNATNLESIVCENTNITSLNLQGLNNLTYLNCAKNSLTSLDVSVLPNLETLNCFMNSLTTLDVSTLIKLKYLQCSYNQLQTLFIKNGSNESDGLYFSNNPGLKYICADESQLSNVQSLITQSGYTTCHTNSYCSFTPGGTFYTIQGNHKFDGNNNGCDASDGSFTNVNFALSIAGQNGRFISSLPESYFIPVPNGTHTITPALENPTYFAVSPTSLNVSFPTQTSPYTQNFCFSPNGIHPDLEIVLLPLERARPGFITKYMLFYKNKGNTIQSGTVNLTFNDNVLDFVSSGQLTSSQSVNNLTWDFNDLKPLETRQIVMTFEINSPMETPAVNGGDVLSYTATIASGNTDEMPNDNTFTLNQTVVNSFDPNDKTCLEGTKITPAQVGDYVHYMIRFENTGTTNAQSIVVKDMIDMAKFDVSSLIPMKGSHPFVTKINSGNKVEFIFENINLPFDNANNDGYVTFKIKTKPTLVLGNTFSNTASIYFDYNFPIVTNTATTTIAALSNQDFEFSNYFSLYPNPVHDVLNIDIKETIAISSVSIYNMVGQLVLVIPNANEVKTIDVSNLTTGNYFIKINSDKGTSNTKFIKN